MKTSKRLLLVIISVFCTYFIHAQNGINYGVSFGPNYQTVKESRFNSNFRSGLGISTDLYFGFSNDKAFKTLHASFIFTKVGKELLSPMIALNPELRFEYIPKKRFKAFHIGAYADVGSFLGFRTGPWPDENGISYAIWSSLGLVAHLNKELKNFGNTTYFRFSISNPIVSYLTRPASVRFPYPDDFLEQENFNFDLDGLGSSILTSGKLKTLDSFVNLKIQTGFEFRLKEGPWHFGIYYGLHYLYVREQLSLVQFNSQINFVIRKF